MSQFQDVCDEHYINLNLTTETQMPQDRGSVMHFFELLRKRYPGMRNFYSREQGDYVLEEDKYEGSYRWITLDPKRLSAGFMKPESFEAGCEQHLAVLESIPHQLSISPLDCETLNLTYGFEFSYSGNQYQLLANALGLGASFEKALEIPGAKMVSLDPTMQISLVPDCRIQARLSFEPRTTAYQVKTNEFPEENLTVFFTIRKYGSIESGESYVSTFQDLMKRGQELVDSYLMENVLVPLQTAILIN
jgi:hypothetical protein